MTEALQIGSKIWCHDGQSHTRPFFESEIHGETRVSWLVGVHQGYKVNKKTMLENQGQYGHRRWHTEESMMAYRWLNQHPHRIAKLVEKSKDIDMLLRVAILVGYVVEPPQSPAAPPISLERP